jgi:hypothetical protein
VASPAGFAPAPSVRETEILGHWTTGTGAPHPGIEPGSDRLEGDCPSVGRVGPTARARVCRAVVERWRAETESNRRARFCRPRSSSENRLVERTAGIEPASAVWKAAVLPLNDVRETSCPRRESNSSQYRNPFSGALPLGDWGGGIGETRTRIAWVQARHSPFEIRSRLKEVEPCYLRGSRRSRGNRTLSPSFGGSAGHHDSATQERRQEREEVSLPPSGPASRCNRRCSRASPWRRQLDSNRWTPHGMHRAPRTGVEPVSLHRQWSCDAGRITRHDLLRPRQESPGTVRSPRSGRSTVTTTERSEVRLHDPV